MSETASAAVSVAFHGLTLGMVLYLISVGLSVTMGLMGFVNLAHGAFAMAGGYVMTTLMNRWGVDFPLALLVAVAVVTAASLTMGLIFMSVGAATYIWGPLAQPMRPPELLRGQISLFGRSLPAYRTFLILCGAIIVTLLWLAVERTRLGTQLRAAVDNLRMAETLGINTSRLFATAFALGSGLAALGGGLGADLLAIAPGYALDNLVYFLIIVAVGGLGSIRGPFVAALGIGIADTAFKYFVPEFGAFFIYALTMAILLRYPNGIFGRT